MSVLQTATEANLPNFVAPIFIAAASDDNLGLAPHSVELYLEWLNAKQVAELHMYTQGDTVLVCEK